MNSTILFRTYLELIDNFLLFLISKKTSLNKRGKTFEWPHIPLNFVKKASI